MTSFLKPLILSLVAAGSISTSAAFAAENDTATDPAVARQIVVQAKDQDAEVKALVAKLKKSQDVLAGNSTVENNPVDPEIVVENTIDEDAFAPISKTKVTIVKMPTVFSDAQIELYDDLSAEQQVALVDKLIIKYGRERLYPTETTISYSDNYRSDNHTNYSIAYSTSNYRSAGGCKK